MADFGDNIRKVVNKWNTLIQEVIEKLPFEFQKYLKDEMPEGSLGVGFSNSKNLLFRRGGLWKSFNKSTSSESQTATKLERTNFGISGYLGSKLPYASIQERGGFIRSKGKMPYYFLNKWKENPGILFYKIMFLASKKNKGVNIKARPYFEPAVKQFNKHLPKFIEKKFVDEIVKVLNG